MTTLEKTIRLKPSLPKAEPQTEATPSRYTTLETLGKGGLGVVSRGHDTKLDREVAIKRLLPGSAGTTVSPKTLLQEALMLASVNHPNIVSIYDVYEENDEVCIVMELLEGKTLDRVIDSNKLSLDEFSDLVRQTQDALLAASSEGIIHGDIKPQNIIQVKKEDGGPHYKLLDFDQARLSSSKPLLQSNHSTCGSIFFMAPERFEGTAPSHASDTYAMGCVYYLALSGQLPCGGNTPVEIMAAHLRNDITPLGELRPDLPEWLCQWVHWLIARKATERPQSPRAVKDSYAELTSRFSSVPNKFINVPESATPKVSADDKLWQVARGNQIGGPHTWETVQGFLKTKALKTTDLIKNDTIPWIRIGELMETKMQNAN